MNEEQQISTIMSLKDNQMHILLDELPSRPSKAFVRSMVRRDCMEYLSDFLRVPKTKDLRDHFGVSTFDALLTKAKEISQEHRQGGGRRKSVLPKGGGRISVKGGV